MVKPVQETVIMPDMWDFMKMQGRGYILLFILTAAMGKNLQVPLPGKLHII